MFLDRIGESRLIPFTEMTVHVERLPNGQISAYDHDNYEPGFPVGYGATVMEAIADLNDQMGVA